MLVGFTALWPGSLSAQEELQQDTILIKGNQEVPSTLYIAPWKRVGEPLESGAVEGEVGEKPEPLERDIFLLELELRNQEYGREDSTQPQAPPTSAPASRTAR